MILEKWGEDYTELRGFRCNAEHETEENVSSGLMRASGRRYLTKDSQDSQTENGGFSKKLLFYYVEFRTTTDCTHYHNVIDSYR